MNAKSYVKCLASGRLPAHASCYCAYCCYYVENMVHAVRGTNIERLLLAPSGGDRSEITVECKKAVGWGELAFIVEYESLLGEEGRVMLNVECELVVCREYLLCCGV